MVTREEAFAIAWRTKDAYSYDAYGISAWQECCRMLARKGFDAEAIEEIMRSKATRWAGDGSSRRYGRYTSADLKRFIESSKLTPESWRKWMGIA